MSNTAVVTLNKKQLHTMHQVFSKYLVNKKIPYTEFSAKIRQTTITAYSSGKVVFQGNEACALADEWQNNTKKTIISHSTSIVNLPSNLSELSAIGSDEVGNGSYFGPITVCAAFVENRLLNSLKTMGVKDSKLLTDPQILNLAVELKKTIPYRLLVVTPKKYNEIQPKYNAVHMKVALHNKAIYLLLKDLEPKKPEAIIIDQFTPEANYQKYVKSEHYQVNEKLFFTTKGEQHHLAVAAASIISRASFLEELENESEELGIKVPSGAGIQADQVAAKVIKKGGIDLLSNYAKLHFANTEKAKKIALL